MVLTCQDVMVSPDRQITVTPDTSVRDAFQLFKKHRARFLPVVDESGKYHGVFTAPTLLKLLLPRAATIGMNSESTRVPIGSLGFMSLTKEDFQAELENLKDETVRDNMSSPVNIPVVAPTTPIMEGIFLYYKYKRHVVLVDPDTGRFVGTVSSNSLLDKTLG
ncbi:HPP family protein [Cognatishimia activa]|uniref:CBS domain-containing protein n=1 Tax=Cognatishimia activa TaxID=1715691 RepID=UPI00223245C7|nr:CBS domain-containing protein [Cognatishimia activa]UZD91132.1 CBS domain-containing protein [Cognatishimia activa]